MTDASTSLAHLDAERARFEAVMSDGRALVRNLESTAMHAAPFLLAMRCQGAALDLAIRRVSAFALVLSVILGGVVVAGAAPAPILAISAVWGGGAIAARLWAARRQGSLGEFLVDFERGRVVQWQRRRAPIERSFEDGATLTIEDAPHEESPRWLALRTVASQPEPLRIARCDAREAQAVARLFRMYKIRCVDLQPREGFDTSA